MAPTDVIVLSDDESVINLCSDDDEPSRSPRSSLSTTCSSRKRRLCGTPFCEYFDFHEGAHSFEVAQVCKRPKEIAVPTVMRESNRFQHGIDFVRMCIKAQIGARVRLVHSARDGVLVEACNTSKHVALARMEKDGELLKLSSADLASDGVEVTWRPIDQDVWARHSEAMNDKEHVAARYRMEVFCDVLRENCRTQSSHSVFSLDGCGSNREEYHRRMTDADAPKFYTFEIDADVALSQMFLYGSSVVYTGALKTDGFGYGTHRRMKSTPPGIEYLITTRQNTRGVYNSLITGSDCDRVVGLNLDYCGGITLDFEEGHHILFDLLARLPRLVVLCLTFGKRQRPKLETNFEQYAPTPYGFATVRTFSNNECDNKRVVSRIYVRVYDVPRVLHLPGSFWNWNMRKVESSIVRSKAWRCVVKDMEGHTGHVVVYSIEDDKDNNMLPLSVEDAKQFEVADDVLRRSPSVRSKHEMEMLAHIARMKRELGIATCNLACMRRSAVGAD